jgi:integrase
MSRGAGRVHYGQGRVYRPVIHGRKSAVWWLDFYIRGERHRESSGMRRKKAAQRILRDRMAGRENGKIIGRPDRVTLQDLRELVRTDYELNGLRSWHDAMRPSWVHVLRIFGAAEPALAVTVPRCDRYAQTRLGEGAARATVNRELAALRRGFRLAVQKGLVATRPEFEIPEEHNARQGFFELEDFRAVQAELAAPLRPLVEFAYLTGWRRTEILTLTWANIDRTAEVIRLEVGTTKSRAGRTFPYGVLPALKALIDAQWEQRAGLFVFHRKGRQIKDYYDAWHGACDRAAVRVVNGIKTIIRPALVGRIPHDFRRTAVRNLERAGVPRAVAMQLTGHKTEAVYRRYAIVAEQDLRDGVAKLAEIGKQKATRRAPAPRRARVSSSAA